MYRVTAMLTIRAIVAVEVAINSAETVVCIAQRESRFTICPWPWAWKQQYDERMSSWRELTLCKVVLTRIKRIQKNETMPFDDDRYIFDRLVDRAWYEYFAINDCFGENKAVMPKDSTEMLSSIVGIEPPPEPPDSSHPIPTRQSAPLLLKHRTLSRPRSRYSKDGDHFKRLRAARGSRAIHTYFPLRISTS